MKLIKNVLSHASAVADQCHDACFNRIKYSNRVNTYTVKSITENPTISQQKRCCNMPFHLLAYIVKMSQETHKCHIICIISLWLVPHCINRVEYNTNITFQWTHTPLTVSHTTLQYHTWQLLQHMLYFACRFNSFSLWFGRVWHVFFDLVYVKIYYYPEPWGAHQWIELQLTYFCYRCFSWKY